MDNTFRDQTTMWRDQPVAKPAGDQLAASPVLGQPGTRAGSPRLAQTFGQSSPWPAQTEASTGRGQTSQWAAQPIASPAQTMDS
jgi:hypothetical protein